MTDSQAVPRTEAGKRLMDDFADYAMRDPTLEGSPRTYAFDEPTLLMWVTAIEAEAASLVPAPDLDGRLAAARKAMVEREQDLRWCNKDDDCHAHAEGVALAIADFDYATSAAASPTAHSAPPSEALRPDPLTGDVAANFQTSADAWAGYQRLGASPATPDARPEDVE